MSHSITRKYLRLKKQEQIKQIKDQVKSQGKKFLGFDVKTGKPIIVEARKPYRKEATV